MSDSREYGLDKLIADPARFRLLRKEDDDVKSRVLEEAELALVKEALRDLRIDYDMSQSELAKASGVAQPMISRVEREGTNVTLSTLQKVAASFDLVVHLELVPRNEALKLVEKRVRELREELREE